MTLEFEFLICFLLESLVENRKLIEFSPSEIQTLNLLRCFKKANESLVMIDLLLVLLLDYW